MVIHLHWAWVWVLALQLTRLLSGLQHHYSNECLHLQSSELSALGLHQSAPEKVVQQSLSLRGCVLDNGLFKIWQVDSRVFLTSGKYCLNANVTTSVKV